MTANLVLGLVKSSKICRNELIMLCLKGLQYLSSVSESQLSSRPPFTQLSATCLCRLITQHRPVTHTGLFYEKSLKKILI